MVVHLCSWARLQQTAGDSYSVPKVPKEQALNYLKRKRAARLKIKQEKTFQRELFTGHDSGASDVPLQPGSQLQNDSPSLFLFFPPLLRRETVCKCDAVRNLSPCFYYHSWDVNTDYSLSPPWNCSEFSLWLFLCRRTQVQMVEMTFCFLQERGWQRRQEARGESCHLAKPSGALYASDLHMSTCSKYNLLAFVDEPWALRLPEGETRRGERERDRGGQREAGMGDISV